jgi:hypothetical protein
MRKIGSVGLCAAVAFAVIIATASSAAARRSRLRAGAPAGSVFVLKAGGLTVPNGALVNVTGAAKPEYLFKTKVTVETTPSAMEVELECENYLEQGRIQRNTATGAWSVVEVHPVEICEGAPWLEEGFSENKLTLSPPNIATDESTVELFRNEEAMRTEERKQAEKGEEVDPREPLRCAYTTLLSNGRFTTNLKKPLVVKVHNKMALRPLGVGAGCFGKAAWKGSFTLTYQGQPVFPGFE